MSSSHSKSDTESALQLKRRRRRQPFCAKPFSEDEISARRSWQKREGRAWHGSHKNVLEEDPSGSTQGLFFLLGPPCTYDIYKIFQFLVSLPLFPISDCSIVLNPRKLPYFCPILANHPPPPSVRTLCMYIAPFQIYGDMHSTLHSHSKHLSPLAVIMFYGSRNRPRRQASVRKNKGIRSLLVIELSDKPL